MHTHTDERTHKKSTLMVDSASLTLCNKNTQNSIQSRPFPSLLCWSSAPTTNKEPQEDFSFYFKAKKALFCLVFANTKCLKLIATRMQSTLTAMLPNDDDNGSSSSNKEYVQLSTYIQFFSLFHSPSLSCCLLLADGRTDQRHKDTPVAWKQCLPRLLADNCHRCCYCHDSPFHVGDWGRLLRLPISGMALKALRVNCRLLCVCGQMWLVRACTAIQLGSQPARRRKMNARDVTNMYFMCLNIHQHTRLNDDVDNEGDGDDDGGRVGVKAMVTFFASHILRPGSASKMLAIGKKKTKWNCYCRL